MAKKITKKKVTKKSPASKTGAKKKVTKKSVAGKTGAKKKITKKKTGKTTVTKTVKKKTGVKKTAKKIAPKKKTSAKKAVGKKVTAKKKTSTKKAVAQKSASTKKITTNRKKLTKPLKKTTRRLGSKKEQTIEDIISTAEARAKAIKKIKGYGKKDLEHFRTIILDKRNEIIEQLQNLKEQMLDPTTGEYINENSPYSLHMAEQGTDAMEREKTFLYAQRENKFLGYLEDALKRIDAGTYGICIECIEEPQHLCGTCPLIPKERLEAVPHSQHCLPIKQRQEKM